MKRFKILRNIFILLALLLSHLACIDVSYNYATMLCGIEHMGFSAPADTAFIFTIPYVVGIIMCIILAFVFAKKYRG